MQSFLSFSLNWTASLLHESESALSYSWINLRKNEKKFPERMVSGKMEYKKSRSGGSVSSRDLRLAIADWNGCDAGASYPPEGLNH
jgi:hypothetical protein